MPDLPEITEPVRWAIAAAIVVVGVLVGFGLRARLNGPARRLREAEPDVWSWRLLGLNLGRDLAVVLGAVAGVWVALMVVQLDPSVRALVGQGLLAVLGLSVSLAVAQVAAGVVTSLTLARSGVAQSVSLFANITRAAVIGLGGLVVLQSLGISITPVLTALGVGGLAVALALQDTLANLFAGVHILASKKVQVGDFVRLDSGEEGYIVDINWRNTTIRQISRNQVIVPNARFADAILTNYDRPAQDMSVPVEVGVSYDSDLEYVERVTLEVASEVMTDIEAAVTEHEPLVRFHTFGDSSIDFRVILRTREFADQYLVVHEFIKRLHARYRQEGIQIPYPIRTLELPQPLADAALLAAPNGHRHDLPAMG